jgi:tRNA (guanine37-N1)-methyltransferase
VSAPFRVDVFTIFPEYVEVPLSLSLVGRARSGGRLDLRVHDPRDWAADAHRSVDDAPFGGGPGMVMMPEPLFRAVEAVGPPRPLLLCSASGRRFDQAWARTLASGAGFSLLCGRYEGVDQRVADHLCDGEVSVGDYVLAGGEAAALVIVEAVARLVPGVMGNDASAADESFTAGLLEYPQYTRPAEFRGWVVPEVLRSGDHERIARWRRAAALARTMRRRPDLLAAGRPTAAERALLAELAADLPEPPPDPVPGERVAGEPAPGESGAGESGAGESGAGESAGPHPSG